MEETEEEKKKRLEEEEQKRKEKEEEAEAKAKAEAEAVAKAATNPTGGKPPPADPAPSPHSGGQETPPAPKTPEPTTPATPGQLDEPPLKAVKLEASVTVMRDDGRRLGAPVLIIVSATYSSARVTTALFHAYDWIADADEAHISLAAILFEELDFNIRNWAGVITADSYPATVQLATDGTWTVAAHEGPGGHRPLLHPNRMPADWRGGTA